MRAPMHNKSHTDILITGLRPNNPAITDSHELVVQKDTGYIILPTQTHGVH